MTPSEFYKIEAQVTEMRATKERDGLLYSLQLNWRFVKQHIDRIETQVLGKPLEYFTRLSRKHRATLLCMLAAIAEDEGY